MKIYFKDRCNLTVETRAFMPSSYIILPDHFDYDKSNGYFDYNFWSLHYPVSWQRIPDKLLATSYVKTITIGENIVEIGKESFRES